MRLLRRAAPLTAVALALGIGSAPAQYRPDMGAPNHQSEGPINRMRAARRGANVAEWKQRLDDPNAEVRLEAVKSLGESGDPEAVDALMQAVGDSDSRVASKAVDLLGKNRATEATDFLSQRLFLSGASEPLRQRILMSLAEIGDPRAERAILEFVGRAADPDTRGAGIFALGEIGGAAVRDEVERIARSETNPRLKRVAMEALGKIDLRRSAASRPARPVVVPGLDVRHEGGR